MLEDLKHYKRGNNVCSSPFTQQGIAGDAEGKAGQQSTAAPECDAWQLPCSLRQGCWAAKGCCTFPKCRRYFEWQSG